MRPLPSGDRRHIALWQPERLSRQTFARAQIKTALAQAYDIWGPMICASAQDIRADQAKLLTLELGDLLLSTLDLGEAAQIWDFATKTKGVMILRAIRGGVLNGAPIPAGQMVLLALPQTLRLELPQGGRFDLALLTDDPQGLPQMTVLNGAMASSHHLAFIAGYLLRAAPHPEGRAQELTTMFRAALSHLCHDLHAAQNRHIETPYERFKFLIAANIARPDLSLHHIAEAMQISPRQLQRLLKSQGVNFRSYLHQVRLHLAHDLATSGQKLRISELSYRCGFADPNYFSRAYAQYWKVPPSRE